jgi:two-component system KDP operon response regulator KdpE
MGFAVTTESNGERAIEVLRAGLFEAVLLNINMPGIGGIATCRLVRHRYPQLAILTLTIRQGSQEKIEALEAGADDCIVKPFDMLELVARLRAVIRRVRPSPITSSPIRIGELELSWHNRSLTRSGQPVHLTPNEFALLYCLMSHADELVPHTDVFRAVWGQEAVRDSRRLRSLVRGLRKKIEPHPAEPRYLVTEPGFGYRFESDQNGSR